MLSGTRSERGSSLRHTLKLSCLAQRQLCHHVRKYLPQRQPQGHPHAGKLGKANCQGYRITAKSEAVMAHLSGQRCKAFDL